MLGSGSRVQGLGFEVMVLVFIVQSSSFRLRVERFGCGIEVFAAKV